LPGNRASCCPAHGLQGPCRRSRPRRRIS
jgi:hypothetical protein